MGKALVIVESPAKARTIGKFLGSGYVVKSSMGHILDLPVRKLGIDIENDFKPTYEVIKEKKKIVKEIAEVITKFSEIYIATDEDREGEAIGCHLVEACGLPIKKVKRVVFHEITKEAIIESFKNTRGIDYNMVNAQQARRIMDRLVGYKISPLLSSRVRKGLSAGRVQSAALRIIVDREKEIKKFAPQEYWSIACELKKKDAVDMFSAHLASKAGVTYKKLDINNEKTAKGIVKELKGQDYIISGIKKKVKKRNPFPPFITSTLQQEAYLKIGFSPEKTMRVAQNLYEGVKLAGGVTGIITYMRTDSLNIASSAQKEARKWVDKNIGKSYIPESPRIYKTRSKTAQEAHEAIRPVSVGQTPDKMREYLTGDQNKLYRLIWERFVASQMASAAFDAVSVNIKAGNYLLGVSGQTVKFQGFMKVYTQLSAKECHIPVLAEGDVLELKQVDSKQHFTEPPPRFNGASLIKNLEAKGIGRPSTYAPIINTIVRRRYVIVKKKQFVPTEIGFVVNDMLVKHFPGVIDVGFTARMEEELDEIATGEKKGVSVLNDFYGPFEKTLRNAREKMENVKPKDESTSEVCEKCGKPMVVREGRFGKFLACSGFPKCRNAFPLNEKGEKIMPEVTDKACEKCGKPMVIKSGRRGRFLACSGYPECRNTRSLDGEDKKAPPEPTDEVCENCGMPMVIRTGRRGRFMACSGFPKCRNVKSLTAGSEEEEKKKDK